ncbi:hypothetical protein SHELI_v1c07260 [Spiroplasma helicoides]|uniref:Uncharacterized protein n=1 Tax=Spiroplasma helicoides TaxID=216938 RepID=A0A1B3SL71_9MOLU|nr:hypothetical protein SHELI_v1c07260 [Spiroplasma helicoides]
MLNDIVEYVNQKYTKENQFTIINEVRFNWQFKGFPEILNISEFCTYIETKLQISLTKLQEDDFFTKIKQMRTLFLDFIKDLKGFKKENLETYLKTYIKKIYFAIKDFINSILFEYIFFSYIHADIYLNYKHYDIDLFYIWQFTNLELSMTKLKKQLFISMNRTEKELDFVIKELDQKIVFLKSKSKKEELEAII